MDFKQTKDALITQGLISSTEDLILCEDAPSNFDVIMGGALGAALTANKRQVYALTVDDTRIQLFYLDKKTLKYLNLVERYNISDLKKIKASTFLGYQVIFKTSEHTISLLSSKKYCGYDQKEAVKSIFNKLKALKK